MAFDSSGTVRPSEQPGLGPHQKRCGLPLFLAGIRQSRTALESYPSWTLKYAVSAGLAKRKKITALLIFLLKTSKNFPPVSFMVRL